MPTSAVCTFILFTQPGLGVYPVAGPRWKSRMIAVTVCHGRVVGEKTMRTHATAERCSVVGSNAEKHTRAGSSVKDGVQRNWKLVHVQGLPEFTWQSGEPTGLLTCASDAPR